MRYNHVRILVYMNELKSRVGMRFARPTSSSIIVHTVKYYSIIILCYNTIEVIGK